MVFRSFDAQMLNFRAPFCADSDPLFLVRKLAWEEGQWKKQRLLELSDLHYTMSWELVEVRESYLSQLSTPPFSHPAFPMPLAV
jgi:hypothetical protein